MAKSSAYQQAKNIQKRNNNVFHNLLIVEGQKEPNFIDIAPELPLYKNRLIDALNFANVAFESDEYKKNALEYFKEDEKVQKKLSRIPDEYFRKLGSYAWLLNNGASLTDEHMSALEEEKDYLISTFKKEKVNEDIPVEKKTIQDFVKDKADYISSLIEKNIDEKNYSVSVYKILSQENAKSSWVTYILSHFKPWIDEVNEYLQIKNKGNKTDSELQLVESYKNTSKEEIHYIKSIQKDLETFQTSQKQNRKPRKKTQKSVEKVVSKVSYCEKDDNYKIYSILPENIVGSERLYVFNVKTRQLGVYNAIPESGGLSIKGTTIQNFDEKTSVSKTVRKPEQVIQTFVNGGKIASKKTFESIHSKEKPLNGRINKDTVLLKAF